MAEDPARPGIAAALAETLMPLFQVRPRSLMVVLLVDAYYHHGRRDLSEQSALLGFGGAFSLDRDCDFQSYLKNAPIFDFLCACGSGNQTSGAVHGHRFNDAGLGNFHEAVQNSKYATYYRKEKLALSTQQFWERFSETADWLPALLVASQVLLAYAF